MLSDEQKTLVENSLWIVNTVLRKLGQSHNEDLRQDGILCLCEIADKKIENAKWETYAYKTIYLNLLKKTQKENEIKSKTILTEEVKYYKEPKIERKPNEKIKNIYKNCNEKQQQVIKVYLEGYTTYRQMAGEIGASVSTIHKTIKDIKEIANELYR